MKRHAVADRQSLLLHQAAVRLLERDPALIEKVKATLAHWLVQGDPHTRPLWLQWQEILDRLDWAAAIEDSERGQQLRQASPLATVLPEDVRLGILRQVRGAHD